MKIEAVFQADLVETLSLEVLPATVGGTCTQATPTTSASFIAGHTTISNPSWTSILTGSWSSMFDGSDRLMTTDFGKFAAAWAEQSVDHQVVADWV